jgi:two-component system response regulator GlrR
MNDNQRDILLVDDDPSLLRLLSLRLKAAGYSLEAVESGEAALACLSIVQPRLIITDMRMGGMDGMALFQELQQQRPDIPVIILTAHGTIPDAVKATHAGVFSFLSKPFDSKELLEHIHKGLALGGGGNSVDGDHEEWRAEIITRSPTLETVLRETWLVAQSEASVLINGESGTGKELLAKAVHFASPRHQQPFLAINCSAIPAELLESELFGHAKGAFTGATTSHQGLFQAADGGTLFLDEIGDMPLVLQAKLLRVLQEQQVRPVGSTQSVPVDVRIVSATHHDLEELLKEGHFRQDLYYRLNVVNLVLPPLRERREDITLLADHFLENLRVKTNRDVNAFAPEALEIMMSHDWPGNVRQLYNVVEYCVALSSTPIIPSSLIKKALRDKGAEILPLAEARNRFERDYLVQLLQLTEGNVTQAARLAQRNRTDFYKLLNRHQLNAALFKDKA